MSLTVIQNEAAPLPIGPYSQGIVHNGVFYPAGQIGLNPATSALEEGIEAQARRAFANLALLCEAANTDISKTIKVTLLLADMADFAVVNQVMMDVFKAPFPARRQNLSDRQRRGTGPGGLSQRGGPSGGPRH